MIYNQWPIPEGWRCPQCGRVFSPSIAECYSCSQIRTTAGDSSKTNESEILEYVVKRLEHVVHHMQKQRDETNQLVSDLLDKWSGIQ